MVKIEDIIFWLLIIGIIAIAIWMLSGSPTETNALISLAIFVAGSEILLWKALFNMDKKTVIGFERTKNDINNKFMKINSQLNEIKSLVKR